MTLSANILLIGDELLYGQITDKNGRFLSFQLSEMGFTVKGIQVIGDDTEALPPALIQALEATDLVVITGGLGPTKDDRTKKVLAQIFDTRLVMHAPTLAHIEALFVRRGRSLNALNQAQALLPESCTIVPNSIGTAPGMWFETAQKQVVVALPGVPYEVENIFKTELKVRLRERFACPFILHHKIRTVNLPESILAERIADWEDALPSDVSLAYLPNLGRVDLRLTLRGTDEQVLRRAAEAHTETLLPLLTHHVYAIGEQELEEVVAEQLTQQRKTIAVAESCTGGFLAYSLTQRAGASAYMLGGVVAYSNAIKVSQLGVLEETLEEYGAVSELTALQMARNVREKFGADIGLATTGVAGPGGGSPQKPVGTVWVAYSDEEETFAKKLSLTKVRALNIQLTTNYVLDLLRQQLIV
ncbi:MAG: competence/damage-inducible protein A [Bernardetiaceae bacterium]